MAEITSKAKRFVITQHSNLGPLGGQPSDTEQLKTTLNALPGTTVISTVQPPDVAALSNDSTIPDPFVVATMPESTAETLALQALDLRVDPDKSATLGEPDTKTKSFILNPSNVIPFVSSGTYKISVINDQGQGIGGAKVFLMGGTNPIGGQTASDGSITIMWEAQSILEPTALYVVPRSGYWERWVDDPDLDPSAVTSVTLTSLIASFPTIATEEVYGWGQLAMGLDKLPPTYRGAGIKIAVIDSGADTTHPELNHIQNGLDLRDSPPSENWTKDAMGHGSHCAGIITGSAGSNGIRGFAPDAEVHVLGVLPGGYFSNICESVKYCINNGIDVINMGLGGEDEDPRLSQYLALARQNGIACIVAAGNTGRNVLFPGTSPDVLTVGAIGMHGTYPSTTHHARQVGTPARGGNTSANYYAAKFSCHGPKIDLCAPGVAILSSIPGRGYAAWDGTSMAAPHVAGMAALLLAHHPDFQGPFRTRNSERVNELFRKITQSCIPVDVGNPQITGWGLPNVERAFQNARPLASNGQAQNLLDGLNSIFGQQESDQPNGMAHANQGTGIDGGEALAALTLIARLATQYGRNA